ncbi:MAG: (2Fe-2S)-binding protein [Deltaproteobacteria bacterium]|nr:MAG: (2Fe-2S)-binding protein [Deltaproteobacteria bacterium]
MSHANVKSTIVRLRVNGTEREVLCAPNETLLEVLRYRLHLTGTKQGCDKGDCGACTVLIDDTPHLACLTLAALCEGRSIRTVEGLAGPEGLHPVQAAFHRHGAAQCGFCTPGMLMSAVHLVEGWQAPAPPDRDAIRQALSGNLCRCTGYTKILDAVAEAATEITGPAARPTEEGASEP